MVREELFEPDMGQYASPGAGFKRGAAYGSGFRKNRKRNCRDPFQEVWSQCQQSTPPGPDRKLLDGNAVV